jgi:hypothetical protein
MNRAAQVYIAGVIAAAVGVFARALMFWHCSKPDAYACYVIVLMAISVLKLRLPKMRGTYSFGSLGGVFGILMFTLPETLIAGCGAVLVQSVFRTKTKPKLVQVSFNLANVVLTIALGYAAAHVSATVIGAYSAVALAITACVYFVTNSLITSVVLALVESKPVRAVWQEWYVWSFPYYLIGTVVIGLLPIGGQSFTRESILILLAAVYLVHFYCGISQSGAYTTNAQDQGNRLNRGARLFISGVVACGLVLLAAAAKDISALDLRFVTYLGIALIASTMKVKLPGLNGTISLNFVVLLVAIADLRLGPTILISALVAIAQSYWRPITEPQAEKVAFNASSLIISSAVAYVMYHAILAKDPNASLPVLMAASTATLYLTNTGLVSGVLTLIAEEPLSKMWHRCYFWSLPYYLIGSAAASIAILAGRSNGWGTSLLVFPLLALVYVSFHLHITRNANRASDGASIGGMPA